MKTLLNESFYHFINYSTYDIISNEKNIKILLITRSNKSTFNNKPLNYMIEFAPSF